MLNQLKLFGTWWRVFRDIEVAARIWIVDFWLGYCGWTLVVGNRN